MDDASKDITCNYHAINGERSIMDELQLDTSQLIQLLQNLRIENYGNYVLFRDDVIEIKNIKNNIYLRLERNLELRDDVPVVINHCIGRDDYSNIIVSHFILRTQCTITSVAMAIKELYDTAERITENYAREYSKSRLE